MLSCLTLVGTEPSARALLSRGECAPEPVDQRASPMMSWTRWGMFTKAPKSDSDFERMTRTPTCSVILGRTGGTRKPHPSGFMGDDSSRWPPP